MADDSEFSFQLPAMPSPVSRRPIYRTEHFAGDVTQTSANTTTTSQRGPSTPALMRTSGAGVGDRTLQDISAIEHETTMGTPQPQWFARSGRSTGSAAAVSPRRADRSRLEDRVQDAVSQLSLLTDGADGDTTIHVDSPFETKRAKTGAAPTPGDQSRLTVSRLGDLTTLEEPTIRGSHETLEEQFMKGLLSSQTPTKPGIGTLPLLAPRRKQQQQQQQRVAGVPSLCVYFADVFKQALAELSEDMTLAGQPRFEEMVNAIKRQKEARATWLLLNDVMLLHTTADARPPPPSKESTLVKSEREKMDRSFPLHDFDLTVGRAVVTWLEQMAAADFEDYIGEVLYETDDVAWRHTLAAMLARAPGTDSDLVTSLDPDAASRTGGRLDSTDASEEAVFLKRIFTLIRCGRLDMAIKLCQSCNQPWRAATLVAFEPTATMKTAGALQSRQDAVRRQLLEQACVSLLQDPTSDKHERGVYAALIGEAKPLLQLAASWQDALWALLRSRVVGRLRAEAEALAGVDQQRDAPELRKEDVEAIVETLKDHSNEHIRDGARTIHAAIQTSIILRKPWDGLSAIGRWIEPYLRECRAAVEMKHFIAPLDETRPRLDKTDKAAEIAPYLCHFAHLALVLRELRRAEAGESAQAEPHHGEADSIIEAYVFDLIDRHMHACVAVYTAQISDVQTQVDIYSFYLAGITDGRLKSHCLEEARKAGLPISDISRAVVGRVREHDKHKQEESPTSGSVSPADMGVINALEWLLQDRSQRLHALKETNAVLRDFISKGKMAAARELLYKYVVPSDIASCTREDFAAEPSLRNAFHEHVSLRAYVDADDAFNVWHHHTHEMRPTPPALQASTGTSLRALQSEQEERVFKNKQDIWEHRRHKYTQTAIAKLMNVIRMDGWMQDEGGEDEEEGDNGDGNRQETMAALRRKCLPEACLRLVDVLYDIEESAQCMEVAEIIARNENGLLEVFHQEKAQLEAFLARIRKASLWLLERGEDIVGVSDA